MSRTLKLPGGAVTLEGALPPERSQAFNRTAYAATHVVVDPLADCDPWLDATLDWDKTLAYREYLWSLGFGVAEAMDTAIPVIENNAAKIDGIKISLLSEEKEVAMRRRLPPGVAMYTGDDFNYPQLIEGDDKGYSHALLGNFDPIASVAARALSQLSAGETDAYQKTMTPTVPLSRHMFRSPTRFYKTGVVFMAYLNGHQDHYTMVGGQ